jgi:hypothetical protein
MKDEAQLIWETLQQVKGGSDVATCPKCGKEHPINASCGVAHEADDEDTGRIPHDVDSFGDEPEAHEPRVGDVASGDPREYKIGQILKASQTGDHLDGMIVDISEEDGELTFALMEIGEEGWTVRASEIKPGGEPGGKPRPSLATGWK